jgi:hypothetical protein
MACIVAACASPDSGSTTSSGADSGTSSSTTPASTESVGDSAEITGDGGWVCPPNAYEELVLTQQQVESVIGDEYPLTDDNCLPLCEEYSTATYESDPDHDWSITGCSVAPEGETDDSSGSSSSTGGEAGPYTVTCSWFPGCM